MPGEQKEAVTIKLPVGLANEIRALTGQPLSTFVRQTLVAFAAAAKRNAEKGPLP